MYLAKHLFPDTVAMASFTTNFDTITHFLNLFSVQQIVIEEEKEVLQTTGEQFFWLLALSLTIQQIHMVYSKHIQYVSCWVL